MFLYPELGTYFVPFSWVWLAHETMKPYFSHRYLIVGFQYASTAQTALDSAIDYIVLKNMHCTAVNYLWLYSVQHTEKNYIGLH